MSEMVNTAAQPNGSQGIYTPEQAGPLTVSQFFRFMDDTRWQPSWRVAADRCADYYDGNQLDTSTLESLAAKGMGPLIKNVVAPVVNVVLGMEAKTRSDWRVTSDDERHVEVAEAMSAKLKEIERESRADRACSDAYAGQIKAGLAWVEVGRPMDPFQYPHRCDYVHRREIYWDWRAKKPDLSDARYVIRKRWYDVDEAITFFPKWRDLLMSMTGDPFRYRLLREVHGTELGISLETDRGLDIEDFEMWRSYDRHRICLYEIWSRHYKRGHVVRLPDGRVFEWNPKNQMHAALAAQGAIRPTEAVYSRLRLSIWAGPNRLYDTPVEKNYIPYIPFWGYREDRTGIPYGLIRSMISPQDEVNARRQKMMWLLGAKRMQIDSDALDLTINTFQDVLNNSGRPDFVAVLNPNRINKNGGLVIDDNIDTAKEQFQLAKEAEDSVQAVVGVFNSLLGRESSASSGRAIDSLVEQGTTALAEINDNYRFARRMVGQRLMEQAREDLMGQQVTIQVESVVGRRRMIHLNKMVQTEDGELIRVNDVQSATVKVSLDDTPSTASYRQQQFVMLSEVMKGMPPELQAAVAPFWMMASDLQHRKEMSDAIRKAIGQQVEPQNEQEAQQLQQAQAEQQQIKQIQLKDMMLALEERQAKVNETNAKAEKMRAEMGGNPALDGARGEFDQKLADMQAQAKDQIDSLTMELINTRNSATLRETKLMGEVTKLMAEIKGMEGTVERVQLKAEAEGRKAEVDKQIAEINADKDKEVARINAAQEAVVRKLEEGMQKLRDDLLKKIEQERKDDEKRDAAMEKKEKEPAAAPAPQPVTVEVKIEQGAIQVNNGGPKTLTVKKNADGSFTGESKPSKE